jgi:hypothetical protein
MGPKKRVSKIDTAMSVDSSDDENEISTSTMADQLMKNAREQVAREFLQACGNDKDKQRIVGELAKSVLGYLWNSSASEVARKIRSEDDEEDEVSSASASADEDESVEISKHPYDEDETIEEGEYYFDTFKELLKPKSKNPDQYRRRNLALQPTKEAIRVFGDEARAKTMVMVSHRIRESGVVWSQGWLDGIIRDVNCGPIRKPMLLMCLSEERFSFTETAVLGKLIHHINTAKLIKTALKDLGVAEQHPKLLNYEQTPFQYLYKNRKECLQWELFAARAYVCINILKPDKIHDGLRKKLMDGLEKMEDNLITQFKVSYITAKTEAKPAAYRSSVTAIAKAKPSAYRSPDANSVTSPDSVSKRERFRIQKIHLKTHKVLGIYNNINEAVDSVKSATFDKTYLGRTITEVLRKAMKSAGGFYWCYERDSRVPNTNKVNPQRRVAKISTRGMKVTKVYKNAGECHRENGAGIYDCLSKKTSTRGYYYQYIDAEETEEEKEPVTTRREKKKRYHESGSDNDSILSNDASVSGQIESDSNDDESMQIEEINKANDKKRSQTSRNDEPDDFDSDSDEDHEEWPYDDDGETFEMDEKTFDDFKALLKPYDGSTSGQIRKRNANLQPSRIASTVFGEELASKILLTHHHIRESGVVYSPEWLTGTIRDVNCGPIVKSMLLMCLSEKRFATANQAVLGKLIGTINTGKTIKMALDDWEVKDELPSLSTVETPYPYISKNRKRCQLCEIFVARSYICMITLQVKNFEGNLAKKVYDCLGIMESNILTTEVPRRKYRDYKTDARPISNSSRRLKKKRDPVIYDDDSGSNAQGRPENSDTLEQSDEKQDGRKRESLSNLHSDQVSKKARQSDNDMKKKDTSKTSEDVPDTDTTKRKSLSKLSLDKTLEQARRRDDDAKNTAAPKASKHVPDTGAATSSQKTLIGKDSSSQSPAVNPTTSAPKSCKNVPDTGVAASSQKTIGNNSSSQSPPIYPTTSPKAASKSSKDVPDTDTTKRKSLSKLPFDKMLEQARRRDDNAKNAAAPKASKHVPDTGAVASSQKTIGKDSSSQSPPVDPTTSPTHLNMDILNYGKPTLMAISAIDKIEGSPYLDNKSAEVGEGMFDELKTLLEPKEGTGRRTVEASDEAIRFFGKTLATALVLASSRISLSGMIYGSEWRDGRIREQSCGFIPKPMLLLILQEHRLGRAMDNILAKIINDLGLCSIVQNATKAWKLKKQYALISDLSSAAVITKNRPSAMKCIVFVARAFRCMKALKRKKIEDSVLTKVKACLSIITSNMQKHQNHRSKPRPSKSNKKSSKEKVNLIKPISLPHTPGSSKEESNIPASRGFVHNLLQQKLKPKDGNVPARADQEFLAHRLIIGATQKSKTISESSSRFSAIPRLASQPDSQKKSVPVPDGTHTLIAGTTVQKGLPTETDALISGVLTENDFAARNSFDKPKSIPVKRKVNRLPPLPSGENFSGSWFPQDPSEAILNSIETQVAWLTEESMYSLRSNPEIQWDYVWQYACPSLKIELRKIPEGSGNRLEKLVRLHDGIVNTRFEVVKKDIRKKLHRGFLRTRMRGIIMQLRLDSRPKLCLGYARMSI